MMLAHTVGGAVGKVFHLHLDGLCGDVGRRQFDEQLRVFRDDNLGGLAARGAEAVEVGRGVVEVDVLALVECFA